MNDRLVVRQNLDEGIALTVKGEVLMFLKANFHCTWDHVNEYLTVEKSGISVYAVKPTGQPIIRYEYEREALLRSGFSHARPCPSKNSLTYMMAKAGVETQRAERRAISGEVPSLQDLHLPLGGHRFRPALEDVLEMLIDEFGVDHPEGSFEVLRAARERWRLIQTRAAVRDAPQAAIDALESLGYTVSWSGVSGEPVHAWEAPRTIGVPRLPAESSGDASRGIADRPRLGPAHQVTEPQRGVRGDRAQRGEDGVAVREERGVTARSRPAGERDTVRRTQSSESPDRRRGCGSPDHRAVLPPSR